MQRPQQAQEEKTNVSKFYGEKEIALPAHKDEISTLKLPTTIPLQTSPGNAKPVTSKSTDTLIHFLHTLNKSDISISSTTLEEDNFRFILSEESPSSSDEEDIYRIHTPLLSEDEISSGTPTTLLSAQEKIPTPKPHTKSKIWLAYQALAKQRNAMASKELKKHFKDGRASGQRFTHDILVQYHTEGVLFLNCEFEGVTFTSSLFDLTETQFLVCSLKNAIFNEIDLSTTGFTHCSHHKRGFINCITDIPGKMERRYTQFWEKANKTPTPLHTFLEMALKRHSFTAFAFGPHWALKKARRIQDEDTLFHEICSHPINDPQEKEGLIISFLKTTYQPNPKKIEPLSQHQERQILSP